MSRYAVNSLLYRLKKEPEFRARFIADPAGPGAVAFPRPRQALDQCAGRVS
jgi:hypothetical protein